MLKIMLVIGCIAQVLVAEAKVTSNSKYRHAKIDSIILHAIGGPYCKKGKVVYSGAPGDAYRWLGFFESHKVLGVHYIVDRKGLVLSSISDERIANHALGWNDRSIGIELVNNGDGSEDIARLQLLALQGLIERLMEKYPSISKRRIFRHSDVDSRIFKCAGYKVKLKQDPGKGFDYSQFLESLD